MKKILKICGIIIVSLFALLGIYYLVLLSQYWHSQKENKDRQPLIIEDSIQLDKQEIIHTTLQEAGILTDMTSNIVRKISTTGYDTLNVKNFEWSYFLAEDPSHIFETRITPADINYTYFTLPRRIAGEYGANVKIHYYDKETINSRNSVQGPIFLFPHNNPDIPLVVLKSDKQRIKVGETIHFEVVAKIISIDDDFLNNIIVQYDFDGDDERDIITGNNTINYTYTYPMERGYVPQAAVIYKGYKGIGTGIPIIVKGEEVKDTTATSSEEIFQSS